ncbi:MAG TPA: WD40 repeat domain-containing protein, partial [Pseudomonadota bacterium]|nr:WD40 repeat domain-containing protein [Pseudomonadota bacterium]
RERLLEVRELTQWQAQYDNFGTLLSGPQLGYAQRLRQKYRGELAPALLDLIRKSVRAQRRRLLSGLLTLAAVVVLLSGLSLLALRSARRADEQRQLAVLGERTAQARLLSLYAEGLIDSKPDAALLIAARAYALRAEAATRSALLGALLGSDAILRFLPVPAPSAATASGAPARVHSVAFSRDGSLLLAAAGSAGFLLYGLPSGRLLAQRRPLGQLKTPPELYAVAVSPDGASAVAAGQGGQIFLFSLRDPGRPEEVISTSARALYSLDYSPDGARLAAGTGDGHVVVIDMGHRLQPVAAPWSSGSAQIIAAIAYEPGAGTRLAVVGNSGALSVHAAADGTPLLGPLPGGHGYLSSVAWQQNGRTLAAASEDGGVLLWDSTTGQRLPGSPTSPTAALSAVAYSPDAHLLASCGLDGQLTLTPLSAPDTKEPPFRSPGGPIYSCAFSPTPPLLATGLDSQILLWDTGRHPSVHRRRVPALVSAMVAMGEGEEVVVGEVDGGLRRWGRARGELGAPVAVHRRAVNALSRGRGGRWVASG